MKDSGRKLGLAIAVVGTGVLGLFALATLRPPPLSAPGRSPGLGSAGPARRRRTRFRGLGATETSCTTAPGKDVAVRTCITRPKKAGPVVSSPDAVCRLLKNAANHDRESFFTVSLDPGMRVLGVEETHRGHVDAVEVHPREVMKSAVMIGARQVVVAHNHPSGDPTPSADDTRITKRLIKVGQTMGIPVLDHIVIGDGRCVAMTDHAPSLWKNLADDD